MLILRELDLSDERAFLEGLSYWDEKDWSWFSFVYQRDMSHQTHLELLSKNKKRETVDAGRVPNTMLYAFVDDTIVGRVSIRYELNDFLRERGGHIGYSVNPPYRKKGYGSEILRGALYFCKKDLKLKKVLITCSESNIPSIKMIEKFDGVLENQIQDFSKNEVVNRYWINL